IASMNLSFSPRPHRGPETTCVAVVGGRPRRPACACRRAETRPGGAPRLRRTVPPASSEPDRGSGFAWGSAFDPIAGAERVGDTDRNQKAYDPRASPELRRSDRTLFCPGRRGLPAWRSRGTPHRVLHTPEAGDSRPRPPSTTSRLLADAERVDDLLVPLLVLRAEVVEETAALADHLQ